MSEPRPAAQACGGAQALPATGASGRLRADPFRVALLLLFFIAMAVSGIRPADRFVWLSWCLAPVLGMTVLLVSRRRFRPSRVASCLLLLQGLLLLTGAHYGFHAIPFFRFRMPDGTMRACMDWLTHLVDGLAYARITLEACATLRHAGRANRTEQAACRSRGGPARLALCISFALAALWELIEWVASIATQDRFRLTGGFAADTLVDMGLTLLGAMVLILIAGTSTRRKGPVPEWNPSRES